jgi:hypothetical protein
VAVLLLATACLAIVGATAGGFLVALAVLLVLLVGEPLLFDSGVALSLLLVVLFFFLAATGAATGGLVDLLIAIFFCDEEFMFL